MSEPLKPKEIARFAAEGVAIALAARNEKVHGLTHIICGRPAELFKVDLHVDQHGSVRVGNIEAHNLGK